MDTPDTTNDDALAANVDVPDDAAPEQVHPGQPSVVAQASGERDPYYCAGCGRGYQYPAECVGTPTAPHQPIQTVSTDELDGDPEGHTPAPASE